MRHVILGCLLFVLLGCATGYQNEGWSGGFSTTQLSENTFTVIFKGNEYTARDKANDFALLRSAEVTLENGFRYFQIVDTKEYAKTGTYTAPTYTTTNSNTSTVGVVKKNKKSGVYGSNTSGQSTTTTTGGETHNYVKPRTANTIVCFKDKPDDFAYDAAFLFNSLKAKHGI